MLHRPGLRLSKNLPFTAKYEYNESSQVIKTYNALGQQSVVGVIGIADGVTLLAGDSHRCAVPAGIIGVALRQRARLGLLDQTVQAVMGIGDRLQYLAILRKREVCPVAAVPTFIRESIIKEFVPGTPHAIPSRSFLHRTQPMAWLRVANALILRPPYLCRHRISVQNLPHLVSQSRRRFEASAYIPLFESPTLHS